MGLVEPIAPQAQWYLAQLRPNSLHIARRNLMRQSFRVFSPTQTVTRKQAGRFVEREAPLFPGYLFVSFDPERHGWRAINSTLGVRRLVAFGTAAPVPVPRRLVVDLMARCDAEGRLQELSAIAPGDRVRLTSGPFADFVTTVEKVDADRRVWVLLDILGRETRLAVRQTAVQRV